MKPIILLVFILLSFGNDFSQNINSIYEFQKIIPSDQLANYNDKDFGSSVSISGNVAIVGAPLDNVSGENSGSAYIFNFIDGNWVQTCKLLPPDHFANRQFGYSVSISGNNVIVGVPFSNEHGQGSGAVYFFQFNGTSWETKAKRTSGDPEAWDTFGKSVSISGNRAVVSCEGDNNSSGSYSKGAAYIFEYKDNNWYQSEKIIAANNESTSQFGVTVSISGDRVIAGCPYDDTYGSNSGAVYIYEYIGTNWTQIKKIYASDFKPNGDFGRSVCIDANKLIVGAQYIDDEGAAYIFEYISNTWIETIKLSAIDGESFGYNTYFGHNTVINENNAIVCGDLAYYYCYKDGNWEFKAKLKPSFSSGGNGYYNSASISGDIFLIGVTEGALLFDKNGKEEIFLNDEDKSDIVYPNPSSDFIHVNFIDTVNYDITIRDINSKLILSKLNNFNETKVEIADLRTGIYIIELSSVDYNYFIRFQKM
jgi:hypothetical protein